MSIEPRTTLVWIALAFFIFMVLSTADFKLPSLKLKTETQATATPTTQSAWARYEFPLYSAEFPRMPNAAPLDENDTGSEFSQNVMYTSQQPPDLLLVEAGEFFKDSEVVTPELRLLSSLENIQNLERTVISTSSFSTTRAGRALTVFYYSSDIKQYTKIQFVYWDGTPYGLPDRYFAIGTISAEERGDTTFKRFTESLDVPVGSLRSVESVVQ